MSEDMTMWRANMRTLMAAFLAGSAILGAATSAQAHYDEREWRRHERHERQEFREHRWQRIHEARHYWHHQPPVIYGGPVFWDQPLAPGFARCHHHSAD